MRSFELWAVVVVFVFLLLTQHENFQTQIRLLIKATLLLLRTEIVTLQVVSEP